MASRLIAGGLAPASQSQALTTVRSFVRFACGFGLHRLGDELIRETLRTARGEPALPGAP